MMKRLAAAVLLAMVNLLGSPSVDGDDDLDPASDTVTELRKSRGAPARIDALMLASRECDEPLDAAWVAHHSGAEPVAAVTVHRTSDHVASVTMAVREDCPAWPEMLGRALAFCRDEEQALKVVVEVDGVSPIPVESIANLSGFQVARVREQAGVIECYTDLYWSDVRS